MSYCRWSSDDWRSDVYVYEHYMGAWVIHVAGNRVVGDIPKLPAPTMSNIEEYMAAHRAQMAFLDKCSREPITLPHAGETFDCASPGDCAAKLLELRELGYHVPQYAIDELREEAAS